MDETKPRKRKLNVTKRQPGPDGKKKSGTVFKITLPTKWIREMGLSEEERDLQLTFKDKKIIIEKAPDNDIMEIKRSEEE